MSRVDPNTLIPGWNNLSFLKDEVRKRFKLHYTSLAMSPDGKVIGFAKKARENYSFPEEVRNFIRIGLAKGKIQHHAIVFLDTETGKVVNRFTLYELDQKLTGVQSRTVTFVDTDGEIVEHQTYFLDHYGNPTGHPLDDMDWPLKD